MEKRAPPPPPKPQHLRSKSTLGNRISFFEGQPGMPDFSHRHSIPAKLKPSKTGPLEPHHTLSAPVLLRPDYTGGDTSNKFSLRNSNSISTEEKERATIIKELIDTERTYLSDILVTKEIYDTGDCPLPSADKKLLFGQLNAIFDISDALYNDLTNGFVDDYRMVAVGSAFMKNMNQLEVVYCKYCKNQEATLTKLSEYSLPETPDNIKQWLSNCREAMKGQTNAWDLGGLLLKPVQRILKYPLLIKRLLKATDTSHFDYSALNSCSIEIEKVAEEINEAKRRTDIVDSIVKQKQPSNLVHGISKKFNRTTQKLKNVISSSGEDENIEQLTLRLDTQYQKLEQIESVLFGWVNQMRESLTQEIAIANEYLYIFEDGKDKLSHLEYVKHIIAAKESINQDLDLVRSKFRGSVIRNIHIMMKEFDAPRLVLKKRQDKLLDLDRYNSLLADKKEDPELKKSAEVYYSLHDQLLEELPHFMRLVEFFIEGVVTEIVEIQAEFYETVRNKIANDKTDIIPSFLNAMARPFGTEISLIKSWREDQWKNGYFSKYLQSDQSNILDSDLAIKIPSLVPVPKQILTKALFKFSAEFEDELSIEPGDIIKILNDKERAGSDEWWYGESHRGTGWIPRNFVERLL